MSNIEINLIFYDSDWIQLGIEYNTDRWCIINENLQNIGYKMIRGYERTFLRLISNTAVV